jgi:tRNA pseudouridine55 synthase
MATGLLVTLIGPATRLAPYVTLGYKTYQTCVSLGTETDSLDAHGNILRTMPIPAHLQAELASSSPGPALQAAFVQEQERRLQIPPAISAIHVDGERAYERARRGEQLELEARPVHLRSLKFLHSSVHDQHASVHVVLDVSKGYYVRSFARDVGMALGVPAHLSELRRLQSDTFHVDQAHSLELGPRLRDHIIPLETALPSIMDCYQLTDDGAYVVLCGKKVEPHHFNTIPPPGCSAWMCRGLAVAIGERKDDDQFRVLRGFPLSAQLFGTAPSSTTDIAPPPASDAQ